MRNQNSIVSSHSLIKYALNPWLLSGITSFGIALLAYSYSLIKLPLSVAYPVMTSIGLIIVAITSFFFFKESFSTIKVIGTLFIIIGVTLVAQSK